MGVRPRMNAMQPKQSHYGPKELACQGTKHETHTKQEESSKSLASFYNFIQGINDVLGVAFQSMSFMGKSIVSNSSTTLLHDDL